MGRGTASGPMGEAVDHSFNQMEPADIRALVTYLRSIPAVVSAEPATIARPAPESPKEGGAVADALGRKVFEQACVSCHGWTGISALSPFATISGSRAVNDPTATNVAQIVISGTQRSASGAMSMPEFGEHLHGHGDRGGRELRYRTFWQCRVQAHGKGHCGSPRPDRPLRANQSMPACLRSARLIGCHMLLRCTLVHEIAVGAAPGGAAGSMGIACRRCGRHRVERRPPAWQNASTTFAFRHKCCTRGDLMFSACVISNSCAWPKWHIRQPLRD